MHLALSREVGGVSCFGAVKGAKADLTAVALDARKKAASALSHSKYATFVVRGGFAAVLKVHAMAYCPKV
jgi:hypothetical protein